MRSLLSFELVFLTGNVFFSASKGFSLSLIIRNLFIWRVGMDFFGFTLFEVPILLESVGMCDSEILSHYFSEYSFSPSLSALLLSLCDDVNIGSFVIIPQVPDALLIYFQCTLFCSYWITSIDRSSSSLILASVISHLASVYFYYCIF